MASRSRSVFNRAVCALGILLLLAAAMAFPVLGQPEITVLDHNRDPIGHGGGSVDLGLLSVGEGHEATIYVQNTGTQTLSVTDADAMYPASNVLNHQE
ncbi:hypothetical protein ACFLSW_06280, partial [Candidatus Bipolaricaulota bacterium]